MIDAWKDPWIPRGSTRRAINSRGSSLIQKVTYLINPVTEQWDPELVNDLFGEDDSHSILSA